MDNFDSVKPASEGDLNKSIPFDDTPIPFDDNNSSDTDISHESLSLESNSAKKSPDITASSLKTNNIGKKPAVQIVSTGRIGGVKTFFTKLHVGSIDFLDEQINRWLKANPGISVKRTNTVTGMVVGKKTEPHILVTVWY